MEIEAAKVIGAGLAVIGVIGSGIGIGNSFVAVPSLRIDYILHNTKYKSYNYKKHKYELSDHFPISCDILVP